MTFNPIHLSVTCHLMGRLAAPTFYSAANRFSSIQSVGDCGLSVMMLPLFQTTARSPLLGMSGEATLIVAGPVNYLGADHVSFT